MTSAQIEGLTVFLLLVVLVVVVAGLGVAQRLGVVQRLGVISRLWNALWPDFTGFTRRDGRVNSDRGTNRTLYLVTAATLWLLLVIAIWALAAGALRTAWLYSCSPNGFAPASPAPCKTTVDLAAWSDRGIFAAVLILQLLRAVGGVLVITLAAGLVGGAVGFLFGIPRYAPRESPQQPAAGQPAAAAARQQAIARFQLNTNLIQISDWLTNGIVVLSLVELRPAWAQFLGLTGAAALWLFDSRHGSPAVIAAAVVGGAVCGFLYGTLYTQLIITPLIAAVDAALALPARLRLAGLEPSPYLEETLAPQISRSAEPPKPTKQPTAEAARAAHQYDDIDFETLIADPDVSFDDILSWARAKALLDDYRAAARGYRHLLGLTEPT